MLHDRMKAWKHCSELHFHYLGGQIRMAGFHHKAAMDGDIGDSLLQQSPQDAESQTSRRPRQRRQASR